MDATKIPQQRRKQNGRLVLERLKFSAVEMRASHLAFEMWVYQQISGAVILSAAKDVQLLWCSTSVGGYDRLYGQPHHLRILRGV